MWLKPPSFWNLFILLDFFLNEKRDFLHLRTFYKFLSKF